MDFASTQDENNAPDRIVQSNMNLCKLIKLLEINQQYQKMVEDKIEIVQTLLEKNKEYQEILRVLTKRESDKINFLIPKYISYRAPFLKTHQNVAPAASVYDNMAKSLDIVNQYTKFDDHMSPKQITLFQKAMSVEKNEDELEKKLNELFSEPSDGDNEIADEEQISKKKKTYSGSELEPSLSAEQNFSDQLSILDVTTDDNECEDIQSLQKSNILLLAGDEINSNGKEQPKQGIITSFKRSEMDMAIDLLDNKFTKQQLEQMWKNLLSTDLNQNKWTQEEDDELMRLSELFDYQNWEHIAEELNTSRSPFQCITRFTELKSKQQPKIDPQSIKDQVLEASKYCYSIGYMDTLALALLTGIDHKNFVLMYEDLNLHEANKEWDLEEKKRFATLMGIYGPDVFSISKYLPKRNSFDVRRRTVKIKLHSRMTENLGKHPNESETEISLINFLDTCKNRIPIGKIHKEFFSDLTLQSARTKYLNLIRKRLEVEYALNLFKTIDEFKEYFDPGSEISTEQIMNFSKHFEKCKIYITEHIKKFNLAKTCLQWKFPVSSDDNDGHEENEPNILQKALVFYKECLKVFQKHKMNEFVADFKHVIKQCESGIFVPRSLMTPLDSYKSLKSKTKPKANKKSIDLSKEMEEPINLLKEGSKNIQNIYENEEDGIYVLKSKIHHEYRQMILNTSEKSAQNTLCILPEETQS